MSAATPPEPHDAAFPRGLIFTSGSALRLPPASSSPPANGTVSLGTVHPTITNGDEHPPTVFLASCGAGRLRDAAALLRGDVRVSSVTGPLFFTGSYGCVEAVADADTAAELAARFNTEWAAPGPISLATASQGRSTPNWWLRPIPADRRWTQWPIQLSWKICHALGSRRMESVSASKVAVCG